MLYVTYFILCIKSKTTENNYRRQTSQERKKTRKERKQLCGKYTAHKWTFMFSSAVKTLKCKRKSGVYGKLGRMRGYLIWFSCSVCPCGEFRLASKAIGHALRYPFLPRISGGIGIAYSFSATTHKRWRSVALFCWHASRHQSETGSYDSIICSPKLGEV